MENDNNGPVAKRDYPPGCHRARRRSQSTRPGPTRVGGREEEEDYLQMGLPADFEHLDPRDQFNERRLLFERLREHFQREKEEDRLIGSRPDLTAMKEMNSNGTSFDFKDLGEVPGVLVGDTFNFRSEMFVHGLHRAVQGGISWLDRAGEKIASSIVASGGYEDDVDRGEVLEYTGSGGNDYKGGKRQVGDQVPQRGNEALMNSRKYKTPVRVIRGHDEETTSNKLYSYDGLYTVFEANSEVGAAGHKVYKFKLRRLPSQPALKTRAVLFKGLNI